MIAETNHCSHAVAYLAAAASRFLGIGDIVYGQELGQFTKRLESSVKFRFPRNGDPLDWRKRKHGTSFADLIQGYAAPFKLPFDATAIEFSCDKAGEIVELDFAFDAVVVLASQAGDEIYIERCLRDMTHGYWVPGSCAVVLSPDGSYKIAVSNDPEISAHIAAKSRDDLHAEVMNNMGDAMLAVIELISALACINVSRRLCEAPVALNRKRERNGKKPLYSYWVLEIDEGKGSAKSSAESSGGSHASPRVHLRRGHIRRLPDRNVWVNACVVGNKASGMVAKDYAFKPDAGPKIAERMH